MIACSHTLLLLTAVHHIYGALLYNTPWRFHAVFVSIPIIGITALLNYLIQKRGSYKNSILFWLNWTVILVISIFLIGIFEGIYNHLVKDVLYYIGTDRQTLITLFPPPKYEMPNDFIFEFTGVMQAVVTFVLLYRFVRLTKSVLSYRQAAIASMKDEY